MLENRKVSVIVPVYNVEEYLAKCLDSLVNQTLEEIEIIVVNDGSPDNSQAIIDDFANRYPDKIRPFIKENGGLSDARNFGAVQATGEYIGFVDSDDYVDSDMFESMYRRATETNAEVVCCPISHEYANSTRKVFYDESVFGKSVIESPKLLAYANSFAHNKIYLREFWQKHDFLFPLQQWFEDSYLVYNVMLSANKVELVNVPFVHYVKDRADSITNLSDPRLFDVIKSAENIVKYFKEHGAFELINEEVEYTCLRHLMARLPRIRQYSDHAEARRFVREMVDFLNREFPHWRKNRYLKASKKSSLHGRFSKLLKRSKLLMMLYVSAPKRLVNWARSFVKIPKAIKKQYRTTPWMEKRKALKSEQNKEAKRQHIQEHGMEVLHEIQTVLSELGVVSFADFGTCLGLVREGHLLAHDLDMDVGVIAAPKDREKIRIALERRGYRLWREYRYQGNPVEESYHYKGIKVDLSFYEMTDEYARTLLFYTKPGHKYENSWTRHAVQMTYSPIKGTHYEEFNGSLIALPDNPELLMTEKYGPTWRTPDKGWIYWESPAAEKLEEIGCFKKFTYKGWNFVKDKENFLEPAAELQNEE